ncbi:MAG: YhfC family intramembrane metalloprotease [Acetatifactor sp.]|nr:YhfC family intramembrane metalloprotease [Acetatifactor sp.]
MEFETVSGLSIALLTLGAALYITVPILVAVIWKIRKKEPFTSILAGALIFFVFVFILEKPIQNVLIFPTQMGLKEHGASVFINARPFLWAFLTALFPGLFEETGRLFAFKVLLKKRTQRETAISYGIGHGGFEVIFLLGITFINYILYAIMINTGTFGILVNSVASAAPEQVEQIEAVAKMLAGFSASDLAIGVFERFVAVFFHIALSILVFYACKDKKKFMLYPLAILLHTLMDAVATSQMAGIINISNLTMEFVLAVLSLVTFGLSYILLYKKDVDSI